MKLSQLLALTSTATFIAILVYFLGFLLDAWRFAPYPPGNDAIPHLYKTKFILEYWPNIRWDHQWAAGMPLFRWYPPFFFLLQALVAAVTHLPIELVLVIFLAVSYWLVGIGFYLFTFQFVNKHGLSVIAPVLLVSTPILWNLYVEGGLCTRIPAAAFFALSLAATARYIKHPSRIGIVSVVMCIAISILIHPAYGVPALMSCLLLSFLTIEGWKQKITSCLKIAIPTVLLTSWFYVPFFVRLPPHRLAEPQSPVVTIAHIFMLPSRGSDVAFNIVFIPLIAVVVLLSLFFDRKTFTKSPLFKWSLVLLFLFPLLAQTFDASIMMVTLALYLLPLTCSSLGRLYDVLMPNKRFLPSALTSFLVLTIVIAQVHTTGVDFVKKIETPTMVTSNPLDDISRELTIPREEAAYRVAVAGIYADLGGWFNYKYNVPQTRDYYGQGILNPDWNGLFSIVYYKQENYYETNFFLDYWGVKWILARNDMYIPGTAIPHYQKFLTQERYYQLTAQARATYDPKETIYEFTYRNATSIFHISKVPSLLVIGDWIAYGDVFQALAFSDYDSRYVIPVRGSEYIDDYALDELIQFDAVFVRGYKVHDNSKAWKTLEEYVNYGGGLIVETGYTPYVDTDQMAQPSPVETAFKTEFGKEWHFTYIDTSMTAGIEFWSFSPATYGEYPWAMSVSKNETVRSWAKPIVWNMGHPIVAIGELGQGRVVWCGMNLPFHALSYENFWESLFLSRMIGWVTRFTEVKAQSVDYEVSRLNPEKIRATISKKAKGFLFKECYFENWNAYMDSGNGKRTLRIYKAGPDFMYVHIPPDASFPLRITFEYAVSWDEIMGFAISILTLVFLVMYAIKLPTDELPKYARKKLSILIMKAKNWWYKE